MLYRYGPLLYNNDDESDGDDKSDDDDGLLSADDVPVRLMGGSSSSQGRVEVYVNGEWGTAVSYTHLTLPTSIVV